MSGYSISSNDLKEPRMAHRKGYLAFRARKKTDGWLIEHDDGSIEYANFLTGLGLWLIEKGRKR
jgi:hypothetical protein